MWQPLPRVLGLLGLAGCMAQVSTVSLKQVDVAHVQIGETTAEVRRKLGKPRQIIPEAADSEGRPLAVTWIYDAQSVSERDVVGSVQADPASPVSVDAAQHTDNVGGATYHMVFVDGRVSQIVERP
ncbi:MAG: hypothetical protein A3I71_05365 [Omnitrophica WOR_2 bacterium RIFCSPLOWO2_02_FULL_63_16]|nr:MAG: hypothetical protein A2105_04995 [Omnitrophica WOR_2 bacterium GWF2_63_9]OGX35297.1 MAG: hypothetical protein A3B73_00385 [Omnitrophica WOR_2 bacterium RIFCSPHIGHO2_02_FULL_63_39]OGX44946.1 MAG: hypothetical protein A3I71_05365 [Omnitrophica WOR_2 bacterium RIFCSPLOWO2_02_FULL_63_16]OGX49355.1 MAG: hypothetical protein A3G88_00755 [Omnitrophica WOR_2 bacterium RIFCSPLOWO2_12_FULL_63_16]HAM40939.1 hypothetical protein [Candidatus Omnitrophota bacterium]